MSDSEKFLDLIKSREDSGKIPGAAKPVGEKPADAGKEPTRCENTATFAPKRGNYERAAEHSNDTGDLGSGQRKRTSHLRSDGVIDADGGRIVPKTESEDDDASVMKVFMPGPGGGRVREVRESYDVREAPEPEDSEVMTMVYDGNPAVAGGSAGGLKKIAETADGKENEEIEQKIKKLDTDRMKKTSASEGETARDEPAGDTIRTDFGELRTPSISEQAKDEDAGRDESGVADAEADVSADTGADPVPSADERVRRRTLGDLLPSVSEPLVRYDMEFSGTADIGSYTDMLKKALKGYKLRTLILGALALTLFIFDTVVSLIWQGGSIFGGRPFIYSLVNSVFLAGAIVVDSKSFIRGVTSALAKKYDICVFGSIIYVLALIQNVFSYFFTAQLETGAHFYAAGAILIGAAMSAARYFAVHSARSCFVYHKTDKKMVFAKLSDPVLLNSFAKFLIDDSSAVRYSAPAEFVPGFSAANERAYSGLLSDPLWLIVVSACSLLGGIVAGARLRDAGAAVSAMLMTFELAFPFLTVLVSAWRLSAANADLKKKSSYLVGYDVADEIAATDFILVSEKDLLSSECERVSCAPGNSVERAAYLTYVILREEGGIFADALKAYMEMTFNKEFLDSFNAIRFKTEDFMHEGKGSSGWVNNNKVLLGSREFLDKHGVPVPEESEDDKLLDANGATALYLAVEGKYVCACRFKLDTHFGASEMIESLGRRGVCLAVAVSNDQLTDATVASVLGVSPENVKVIRGSVVDQVDDFMRITVRPQSTGAAHRDSLIQVLGLVKTGIKLSDLKRIYTLAGKVIAGLGLLLSLILSIGAATAQMPQFMIFIVYAVCAGIYFVIAKALAKRK